MTARNPVAQLLGVLRAALPLFKRPGTLVPITATALMLPYGLHGKVEWLSLFIDGWHGPDRNFVGNRLVLIPGLPWDQEWVSFLIGFILLVVMPCVIVRIAFGQSPSDYGLGLPKRQHWGLSALFVGVMLVVAVVSAYSSARTAAMREVYPFPGGFESLTHFAVWQLGYFSFFVIIEFIFRGYLLFGLKELFVVEGTPAREFIEGVPAVTLSMLSYCAWHLGKPWPEATGTLFWGLITGLFVLKTRSIWPVVLVHWLMNVALDLFIWKGW